MTRRRSPWLMLGLLGLPALAWGGVIRGTLHLPAIEPSAAAKRTITPSNSHASLPDDPGPRREVIDAVIYVEQVPARAESIIALADTIPATLAQLHRAFVPRVLSIAAGDAVDMPNFDPVYHEVFSLSPIKDFDLGRYARGQSRRVVFDRPGLVNVYCAIHSDMAAFVLVLPHHVFARPDSAGRFALPSVPPGHYTVCVWHPDVRGLRREVRVPDRGDLELDLTL